MTIAWLCVCVLAALLPLRSFEETDVERVEPPVGVKRCVYGEQCGYKDCFCCGACDGPARICQVSETRFCHDEPWAGPMQLRAKAKKVRRSVIVI